MSLLIEVNCFLQSNREVPPCDHEGTWTPVPDFQYLVCLQSYPVINCIHYTDFLNLKLACYWVRNALILKLPSGMGSISSPSPSPQPKLPWGCWQMWEVKVSGRCDCCGFSSGELLQCIRTKTSDKSGWRLSRAQVGVQIYAHKSALPLALVRGTEGAVVGRK